MPFYSITIWRKNMSIDLENGTFIIRQFNITITVTFFIGRSRYLFVSLYITPPPSMRKETIFHILYAVYCGNIFSIAVVKPCVKQSYLRKSYIHEASVGKCVECPLKILYFSRIMHRFRPLPCFWNSFLTNRYRSKCIFTMNFLRYLLPN